MTFRPGAIIESDVIDIKIIGAALLYSKCELMKLRISEVE